jgi:gas vesicle protein
MKTGQVLVGLVAGAAVGAALGVLFAPKSGAELRKDIAEKGGDAFKSIKDKVSGLAGKASDAATGLIDKGKETLEDSISKLEGGKSESKQGGSKLQTAKNDGPAY